MHLHRQRITYEAPADPKAPPAPAAPAAVEPPKQAEPPAAATPAVPEPPKRDWRDDRIAKLTHDLNEERRLRAAATPPAPVQKPGESEADFQRRVDEAATAKAVQLAPQIAAQAEYDNRCNAAVEQGRKDFPDFNARLNVITNSINQQDPTEAAVYNDTIAAIIETGPAAHKVLYALGADPGEFQRVMKLTPVKRAMELGTMASKLVSDKEPSGLPKPITPIVASGEHYEGIRPDDPTRGMKLPKGEWFKQREEQARAKGIQ